MNPIWNLLDFSLVYRLGWTLIHFVWQGALGGLALYLLLPLLRKRTAALRYLVSLGFLFLLAAAPLLTYWRIDVPKRDLNFPTLGVFTSDPRIGGMEELQTQIPENGPAPVETMASSQISPMEKARSSPVSAQEILQQASERISANLPWFVAVWFLGVFLLSARHLVGWVLVQRLKRQLVEPVAEALQKVLVDLSDKLRLKRTVTLLKSTLVETPATIGWLKPVILLPASALLGLSPQQLEAVLAHELAHIKRHDYLVNLFQTVVETLLFYHPVVWWISKKIRVERENCCDDIAVGLTGDAATYARALAELEAVRNPEAFAMAAGGGSLLERIRRLAADSRGHRAAKNNWFVGVVALVVTLFLIACGAQFGSGEDSETGADSKPQGYWRIQLQSGIEVELVGVSNHPSTSKSWWGPDGKRLSQAPYEDSGASVTPGENESAYEFAVRLINVPEEFVQSRMETVPTSSSAGGGSDEDNTPWPHTRAIAAALPKDLETCGLRVGVAAGDWMTAIDYRRSDGDGHWPSSSYNGNNGSFAFSPPLESEGRTVFTLTHDIVEDENRIVAFDRNGNLRGTISQGNQGVGGLIQTAAIFDILLEEIDSFAVQKRPYEWVEFKDLPLAPSERETVQEAVSDEQPGALPLVAELPDGTSVELVGVTTYPIGDDWWKPDGSILDKPPYQNSTGNLTQYGNVLDDHRRFHFSFHVRDVTRANELSFQGEVPGSVSFGFGVDQNGELIPDRRTIDAIVYEHGDVIDVSFAVSTTPRYETIAVIPCETDAAVGVRTRRLDDLTLIDHQPFETEEGSFITLAYTNPGKKYSYQLLAEDREGRIHGQTSSSYADLENAISQTFQFANLALEEIDRFLFQRIAWQWVVFKNVALRPGIRTIPEVSGGVPREVEKEEFLSAIRGGDLSDVRANLEKDATLVNARNEKGQTPLILAAREGHKEIVEFLLEQGAEVNAEDNDGKNAWHHAAYNRHPDIATLLIEHGARWQSEEF